MNKHSCQGTQSLSRWRISPVKCGPTFRPFVQCCEAWDCDRVELQKPVRGGIDARWRGFTREARSLDCHQRI